MVSPVEVKVRAKFRIMTELLKAKNASVYCKVLMDQLTPPNALVYSKVLTDLNPSMAVNVLVCNIVLKMSQVLASVKV